jgi:hypothetical protein
MWAWEFPHDLPLAIRHLRAGWETDAERAGRAGHLLVMALCERGEFKEASEALARLGEWSEVYGSRATERKEYVGRCIKYFSNIGVAEFLIENADLCKGQKVLITGNTTGALIQTVDEIRFDLNPVDKATRGQHISFKTNEKVRPNDKLYLLIKRSLV